MGTIVLADITELTTVKISELPKLPEAADNDVVPILDKDVLTTKGIEKSNLTHKQNTDTILDEGGTNEISVTEIPRKTTVNIEYWIATDGDDSDPGTEAEPFATIQYAIDLLPKVLETYQVDIILKDGTYDEDIQIKGFIGGSITIYSDSWDADLVLIKAPVDKAYGVYSAYNSTYIYLGAISVKTQRNYGYCIVCVNSTYVDIEDIKVGDNDNVFTTGIYAAGSKVAVGSVTDIDANKVSTGIKTYYGGIVFLYSQNPFGDTFTDVSFGGIITDGIRLIKADYDDAITKKHTQNTDTALGAQSENLDMNTHKIVNVVNPVNNQDATTKLFVSNMDVNGGGF